MKTIEIRREGTSRYDETLPPAQERDPAAKPIIVRWCCIDHVIVNDEVAIFVAATKGEEKRINLSSAELLFEVGVVNANRDTERWIGAQGALDRYQRRFVIMRADNDSWVDGTPRSSACQFRDRVFAVAGMIRRDDLAEIRVRQRPGPANLRN